MKSMLKLAFLFLMAPTYSMAQQDLAQQYHVVNDQIVRKVGEKQKNVHPHPLPLKAIDISKTIFVGQKQAVTLDFVEDNSPYTCAVSVDACPCLLVGVKTKQKGGLIHFDETTQVKSIATYLKTNFSNQGPLDIYINGLDNSDVDKILDDHSTTQRRRIDSLKQGISSSCKKLRINIIDNTGDQNIYTSTNEKNTLGVSKDGFFTCFFYNNGVYYKQEKETITRHSEIEQTKIKEFLSIYNLGNRRLQLFLNYIKVEAPQRFGIPFDSKNKAKKIPLDVIDLKKLIADKENPFPNLFPIAHWQTNPVWQAPKFPFLDTLNRLQEMFPFYCTIL